MEEGRTVLCFPDGSEWFQGYFYAASAAEDDDFMEKPPTALGLLAVEMPVDDCVRCRHGGYREYKMTIINYDTEKEATILVQKTGGDFCTLATADSEESATRLNFDTSSMLTDEKAAACIRQMFPTIASRCENDDSVR
ncbi:Aste57867_3162 [Aphanomyces stellatus]|uniref:Aste57867_3162 protein n=1 Tax=Aphanomyces stellatus TaxID=120398 RepID=A0A485K955_9STRA|nr:hypothetical protein As57867_003153 [Aphanomyces stellatus]VFT80336.1 Aste57867_3162 [Aphanomyces stellatus]